MEIGRQLRVIIVEPEEVGADPVPAEGEPLEVEVESARTGEPAEADVDADVEEPLG